MKPRGADLCTEPFEQVPPVLRTYMWDLKRAPVFPFELFSRTLQHQHGLGGPAKSRGRESSRLEGEKSEFRCRILGVVLHPKAYSDHP